jgi:hypothetical protein
VKLIDFGLCAPLKTGLNAELETCCGSPAYGKSKNNTIVYELVKSEANEFDCTLHQLLLN